MRRSRVSYLIEVIIHVMFWTGVYYALKAVTTTSLSMLIRTGDNHLRNTSVSVLFRYSWVVLVFLMVLFYSNSFWLLRRVIRYKRSGPRVLVVAGWFILLFSMDYLVVRWLMGSPETMRGPRRAPFDLPPPVDSWGRMQLDIFLVFVAVLAAGIVEFFIKAEAQRRSIEIKFLRSQVNPHFLFNTLNNLFSMAQKKGHDELADGISKLSGMMRYMIYESNTEKVSLQREIEYLKDYIALNKLRYADSEVAVTFSHPTAAAIADVRIAPMLFIPFVENAFKHGVSIGSRSCIGLSVAVDSGRLCFSCENADHSAIQKPVEDKAGIGLANVKRHLELVYAGGYELVTRSDQGNYTVHLEIDLR